MVRAVALAGRSIGPAVVNDPEVVSDRAAVANAFGADLTGATAQGWAIRAIGAGRTAAMAEGTLGGAVAVRPAADGKATITGIALFNTGRNIRL
jgi:hypothetical protein